MPLALSDVEQFRRIHESDAEWKLRKQFIIANCDSIPSQNRLLCLANCFINVECYGCRYPAPVMKQLETLSTSVGDVLRHHREDVGLVGSIPKTNFVKASHR